MTLNTAKIQPETEAIQQNILNKSILLVTGVTTVIIASLFGKARMEESIANRRNFDPTSLKMSSGETASYMLLCLKSHTDPEYLKPYSELDTNTLINAIKNTNTDVELIKIIRVLEIQLKKCSEHEKIAILDVLKQIFNGNSRPVSFIAAQVLARNDEDSLETPWRQLIEEYARHNSSSMMENAEYTFYDYTSVFRAEAGKPPAQFNRPPEKYIIAAECAFASTKNEK